MNSTILSLGQHRFCIHGLDKKIYIPKNLKECGEDGKDGVMTLNLPLLVQLQYAMW